MSDDGYYEYDPEYEEFTDMLYEADANPDLADDLASRAIYSPVWQDDVAEELRDYFSDWDYYSDDYFDDDPSLMGTDQKVSAKEIAKRGKKRKATVDSREPPAKRAAIDALTACLRGTVWKSPSPDPPVTYRKGMVAPVALKLPKEIMQARFGRRRNTFAAGEEKKQIRSKEDETWANDLSLADMGLKTERSMSTHEPADVDDMDEEDLMSQAVDDEDEESGEAVEEEMLEIVQDHIDQQLVKEQHDADEIDDRPRKRKKGISDEHQVEKHVKRNGATTDGAHGAGNEIIEPSKAVENAAADVQADRNGTTKANGAARKRKLSVSDMSATSSTASSRAKRMDLKKSTISTKSASVTAASTRPSRKAKS